MRYLFTLIIISSFSLLKAQVNQEIGQWESYLPYRIGIDVTQSDSQIIYATAYGIMMIDKNDFSIQYLSKINGLSDIGIKDIDYDFFNDQLIIVYQNSNIDVLKDGQIINLSTIKENKSIIGSKAINDIYIYDRNSIFLSTNFGIVELDGESLFFGNTIFTDVVVKEMTSLGTELFAASNDGVYHVDYTDGVNIADFNQWTELTNDGLPTIFEADHIEAFNDDIYIAIGSDLYRGRLDGEFEKVTALLPEDHKVVFFSHEDTELIIGAKPEEPFSKIVTINAENEVVEGGGGCINLLYYAIKDDLGRYWYADGFRGFRYTDSVDDGCHKINLDGPLSADGSDLKVKDGALYVASGGVNENFSPGSNRAGFFIFDEGTWTNYNDSNLAAIKDNDFANIYQVEPHPTKNLVYLGSYYNGIIELNLDDQSTQYFSTENSALLHPENDNDGERISGLDFDRDGNLWINNIYAERPLVVYTADGNWYNYSSIRSNGLAGVTADENGYIWSAIVNASGGVFVFDHNGTLNDPTDDRRRILDQNNSAITSGFINCITVDRDGDIWVGTDSGPVIFNSSGIFDADNPGNRLKVIQDSIPAYLLSNEDVRAIEADGANRKWIGTRNGIFVMSPSGDSQITEYNVNNSLLFDNNIIDLEFDGDSGIMYISSSQGVQSIRTETTGAKSRHAKDVYAFPNPVRPDYRGTIYIKGLAQDADIKITDLNGKLVHSTQALGGQASWDGNDLNGSRVSTGTYLVFSTGSVNINTPDTYVTKILVVN